jgi:hypothetical protein
MQVQLRHNQQPSERRVNFSEDTIFSSARKQNRLDYFWYLSQVIIRMVNIFGIIFVAFTTSIEIFLYLVLGGLPLPGWFNSYMFVPGFSIFAATAGLVAIAAIVNIFIYSHKLKAGISTEKEKKENRFKLISALITFVGASTACAGAILLASGVTAGGLAAVIAVSILFVTSFVLVAVNAVRDLYNEFVSNHNLSQKEKVKLVLVCGLICILSILGIFTLLAKFFAVSVLVSAVGCLVGGGFLVVSLIIAVCAYCACKDNNRTRVSKHAEIEQEMHNVLDISAKGLSSKKNIKTQVEVNVDNIDSDNESAVADAGTQKGAFFEKADKNTGKVQQSDASLSHVSSNAASALTITGTT